MGVIRHKIWFDLWHNKGRSMLVVLSIAAGVFAIGVVFGMVDQLLSGMDRAHREVNPSHFSIILSNFIDQETVDELLKIPGVAAVEPVNQISVRYKTSPNEEWSIGTLVQRPDYEKQNFDVVQLKEGQWPAGGRLSIERLTSQYFNIFLGQTVIFEVGPEEKSFTVEGKIRHPFVEPPQFGGQAHFFSDSAGLAEFGVPEGYFGQLLVRIQEPYSAEKARSVAGFVRTRLSQQGIGVVITLYQDPDRHWGRMFVEGITLVLRSMAVVTLLLSLVLVLNTMTAVITQQTDQIGVIKAIGGSSATIVWVYLLEVLAFGLVALAIALPAGVYLAYRLTGSFLNLFNIDYTEFVVSERAVTLMILSALVTPLISALWPILKGAWISVREAISSYGLGGDFVSSRLDRLVDRIGAGFLPTLYAAALGNLFRRKGRLTFSVLVLTIAGIMFLVVMSLISSIRLTLDNETARQGYDVRIGFAQNHPIEKILTIVEAEPALEKAEVWFSRNVSLYRQGERLEDSAGLGAQLIGIPSDTEMYRPLLVEGRWLEPNRDAAEVVLNHETAENNQIAIGDQVTLDLGELGRSEWSVVGTYRTVYSSGFVVEPIYAPLAAFEEATGVRDQGNQVLLRGTGISSLIDETAFADRLETAFESDGLDIDFYTTSGKLEARDFANNQFNTIVNLLLNLAVLVANVGGLGLMGALGISVMERTREIGVMRAIGGKSFAIGSLFVMEGLLQGLLSFFLSVPAAYLLAQPLARLLGQTMIEIDLDYAFNFPAVGIWLGGVLVLAVLFSLWPARNATRISVRESLAYS